MSCCGSKRRQQFPVPPLRPSVPKSESSPAPATAPPAVPGTVQSAATVFVYAGATALTVTGRATRRNYRFSYPGARVAIDVRDVPGLHGIPMLRRA